MNLCQILKEQKESAVQILLNNNIGVDIVDGKIVLNGVDELCPILAEKIRTVVEGDRCAVLDAVQETHEITIIIDEV